MTDNSVVYLFVLFSSLRVGHGCQVEDLLPIPLLAPLLTHLVVRRHTLEEAPPPIPLAVAGICLEVSPVFPILPLGAPHRHHILVEVRVVPRLTRSVVAPLRRHILGAVVLLHRTPPLAPPPHRTHPLAKPPLPTLDHPSDRPQGGIWYAKTVQT